MPPSVAFIGHLSSAARYAEVLSAVSSADLAPIGSREAAETIAELEPMPLCDFWFRSLTGRELQGRYIELWLLLEDRVLVDPTFLRAGLSRVEKACFEARAAGARIAALGGFASILGESASLMTRTPNELTLTTGNTLTAGVLSRQVATLAGPGTRVTVVGAAGDVGSGLCRSLSARGHSLLVVGRSRRSLEQLALEVGRAEICELEEALQRSEVVVLVASVANQVLSLAEIGSGAIVIDAGHPPNVAPLPNVRYALGGKVSHAHAPVTDLEALTSDCKTGETHACLAEALVLAYEERYVPFSGKRGQIRIKQIDEILELSARHGIEPAPLHMIGGE